MHKRADLIANKLGLKFYTPPPPNGDGRETSKAEGKKLVDDLGEKGKIWAEHDMHMKGFNGGDAEHEKGPVYNQCRQSIAFFG